MARTPAPFHMGKALGVQGNPAAWRLALYFPHKDRAKEPINAERYVHGCMDILTHINRGATRLPLAEGTWLLSDPPAPTASTTTRETLEQAGLILEDTTVVYSYIFDVDRFIRQFDWIKVAFYTFGEETNQNELFLEYKGELKAGFFDRAYRIPRSIFLG